jgi:hypothetical protein
MASTGDAETIWRNLIDLGGIARFAPSLASSGMRGNAVPAAGVVRDCVDRSGRRWSEQCVAIDEVERRLVMKFMAQEPGFPFPFTEMNGGWLVRETDGGTMVRVWWDGQPRYPLLNPFVLPLLAWQARGQFPEVVMKLAGESKLDGHVAFRPAIAPC